MSITRLTTDSDVYVYYCDEGVACCFCRLMDDAEIFIAPDKTAAIAHLEEHLTKGHKVPDYAFAELRGGDTCEPYEDEKGER